MWVLVEGHTVLKPKFLDSNHDSMLCMWHRAVVVYPSFKSTFELLSLCKESKLSAEVTAVDGHIWNVLLLVQVVWQTGKWPEFQK